jgi:hypothetical protein
VELGRAAVVAAHALAAIVREWIDKTVTGADRAKYDNVKWNTP